jgi:hypothetical protein
MLILMQVKKYTQIGDGNPYKLHLLAQHPTRHTCCCMVTGDTAQFEADHSFQVMVPQPNGSSSLDGEGNPVPLFDEVAESRQDGWPDAPDLSMDAVAQADDLEEAKILRKAAVHAKTDKQLSNGVPAHVEGVEYRFDTDGKRAAANWSDLADAATFAADNRSDDGYFPQVVETVDKQFLSITSSTKAREFLTELKKKRIQLLSAGANYLVAIDAAPDMNTLNNIVDGRPDIWFE